MITDPRFVATNGTLGTLQTTHVTSFARKLSDAVWMAVFTAVPLGVIVKWAMDGALERTPAIAIAPGLIATGLVYATVRMVRGEWRSRVDVHAGGLMIHEAGKITELTWDQISSPTVVVGRSRRLELITGPETRLRRPFSANGFDRSNRSRSTVFRPSSSGC